MVGVMLPISKTDWMLVGVDVQPIDTLGQLNPFALDPTPVPLTNKSQGPPLIYQKKKKKEDHLLNKSSHRPLYWDLGVS